MGPEVAAPPAGRGRGSGSGRRGEGTAKVPILTSSRAIPRKLECQCDALKSHWWVLPWKRFEVPSGWWRWLGGDVSHRASAVGLLVRPGRARSGSVSGADSSWEPAGRCPGSSWDSGRLGIKASQGTAVSWEPSRFPVQGTATPRKRQQCEGERGRLVSALSLDAFITAGGEAHGAGAARCAV